MTLYLLRHALAAKRGPAYHPDSQRPLVPKGARKMKRIAKGMAALDVAFDALLTSPFLRAKQTAEILAEVYKAKKKLVLADELTPEGNPRELIKRINRDYRGAEAVLLVGHEPYLSQLISTLLTARPDLPLEMKKGGLCRLRMNSLRYGACAVLECLLTPQQLIAATGKR